MTQAQTTTRTQPRWTPVRLSEYTVRTIDVKRIYKMGTEEVHALRGVDVSDQPRRVHLASWAPPARQEHASST